MRGSRIVCQKVLTLFFFLLFLLLMFFYDDEGKEDLNST